MAFEIKFFFILFFHIFDNSSLFKNYLKKTHTNPPSAGVRQQAHGVGFCALNKIYKPSFK
jgi:hypothetical protein